MPLNRIIKNSILRTSFKSQLPSPIIFNNSIQYQLPTNEPQSLPPQKEKNDSIFVAESETKPQISSPKHDTAKTEETEQSEEYIWLKLADKGTFGTVYKVKDARTDKIYAIKRVYQDPAYVNTEHQILTELDHINCIKTHRAYYTKDKNSDKLFLNIVMDYIPSTLYDVGNFYKKRETKIPTLVAKIYAYQMFRALLYLESKSIVHRDIKPKNILIDPQSHHVIFADFGSAKIMQADTMSIAYICTRFYRAPELLLGDESYRYKVDVWAVGCCIAEMVMGSPLFMGKSSSDQLLQIIKVLGAPKQCYISELLKRKDINLPPCKGVGLHRKLENIDPLLFDLISKTLVYDPNERISPVEALIHPCFNELRHGPVLINGKPIVDLFNFNMEELSDNLQMFVKLVPTWYVRRKIEERGTGIV